ncbi:outer membrane beta-barrel protein [Chryseobacterium sp. G0201]|uniref:outer membrane beta-barrel protein n=1 Tax=Chryseobacterium sp. G0201 TaxID=2487065 RepID=UPI001E4DC4AA|nr:outer membrane beta-barrel protein [Chryseobacterium sp. G0201]
MVNPAYSIGGYSAAAITGLGRNLNNRHWISDVLAGIGIISTELGYFFIDKIYKNKGDNLEMLADIEGNGNPSFVSLKVGSTLSTTNFLKESDLTDKKEVGFEVGIEGAYFFSKKWGMGGHFSFSSFPIHPTKFLVDNNLGNFDITTQSLGFLNFAVGPYFSHEISDNLVLKATAGYSSGVSGKFFMKSEIFDLPTDEFQVAEYKPSSNFRRNSGAALPYKFKPELGIKLYIPTTTKHTLASAIILATFSKMIKKWTII